MPTITIDGEPVEVPAGATILDAARKAGIEIPTLCHREGHPPLTSCFVCVVRVNGGARLLPSCATLAAEGMAVESASEGVRKARRAALELLLGDHLGDCIGPCQGVCPAHMDIPRMIGQIAAGRLREALVTVKERIALPAVLGRICPEICEKGCRRAHTDGAVSICMLKRHVADADLASGDPYLPPCAPASGKRVAIVGSGPAGLSAAWYLLQEGHACTLFDEHDQAGGALRTVLPEDVLPRDVLDAEIALIARLGAEFRLGARVTSLDDLRREFDAVLVTVGPAGPEGAAALGLPAGKHGVQVERLTLATPVPGVFAAGSAVAPTQHAVRAVADGRTAALSIARTLAGEASADRGRPFSTHMGRLHEEELAGFAAGASVEGRTAPAGGPEAGYAVEEAVREAMRCLRCDCSKQGECQLRRHAIAYDASPTEYRGERREYAREDTHPDVVYEPGKCISCGVCVQIAAEAREDLGLTFIGRGFSVRVGVPFSAELSEGLRRVARECAAACPTGALAPRERGG